MVKQNFYQVLMMQGGNLDLDHLLFWVCFRCLSMSWDRSQSWNKRVSIPGNCREFNWTCLLLSWTSSKTSYEQTKRKPRPAKADNVVVFGVYGNIFILLTVTWEIFYYKGGVTRSFFNDHWSFFYFCHWKYLNTSPVVEKLDGRKNLTYSSYLFSIGYKITITNWNQQALLDVYVFHHVTVLFLEGEN